MRDAALKSAIAAHADQLNALNPDQLDAFHVALEEEKGKYAPGIAVASAIGLAKRLRPGDKVRPIRNDIEVGDELPKPTIALELMERDMPAISYLREPWIAEGLNILAGRPKLGKTTLLRQKLAAV